MRAAWYYCLLFIITSCDCSLVSILNDTILSTADDATDQTEGLGLDFIELAERCGLKCNKYEVTTDDGYQLGLFKVQGDSNKHIILSHGVFNSADGFILRENTSLVMSLSRKGYNIWLTNARGNKYSRKHVTMDPDKDKKFWEYSFHEIGLYDMPANIDFVLNQSGLTEVPVIAHSDSTTSLYIMSMMKSEYRDKVKPLIALGSVAFLDNMQAPPKLLAEINPVLNTILETAGVEELFGKDSDETFLKKLLCTTNTILSVLNGVCADIVLSLGGCDRNELTPDFSPKALTYWPAGGSRQYVIHLFQMSQRKKFAQYDYGIVENLLKYGSSEPPLYNLSEILSDIYLFVGKTDKLSTKEDVELFMERVPKGKVAQYMLMPNEQWNHYSFIWGENMDQYLDPYIYDVLDKY